MSKQDRQDALSLMRGIAAVAMVTKVIRNSGQIERFAWSVASPGRCWFCGYRYDHPIVTHDDTQGYCGW